MGSRKLIFWFDEIGQEYNDIVGKKSANLGAMKHIGMPVPLGFAIGIDAYRCFIEETRICDEISRYVSDRSEAKRIEQFEEISKNIRKIIESNDIPKKIKDEITYQYQALCSRKGAVDVPVSVRSAGTESRPGMFDTYLNVIGSGEVLEKVKRVRFSD